jgi:hypothetical protein
MISADLSFTATRLNFPSYYIKCFYQNHENNLMIGHGKTSRRRLKNALAAERRHRRRIGVLFCRRLNL